MKKYSKYYKTMMVMAIIIGLCACIAPIVEVSAVLFVVSFILWFGGVMAPDYEKYVQSSKQDKV